MLDRGVYYCYSLDRKGHYKLNNRTMKIKAKTFSNYKLIDKKDFMQKVYKYLIDKNMGFCFLEDGTLISRESCEPYLS